MPDTVGGANHQSVIPERIVGYCEIRLPVVLVVVGGMPRIKIKTQLPCPVAPCYNNFTIQGRLKNYRVEEGNVVMCRMKEGGIVVCKPHCQGQIPVDLPGVLE